MMTPDLRDDWRPWAAERTGEFIAAVAFLTRIPFARPAASGAELAPAVWAFPLAGVIVGAVGAVVYALTHRVGLSPWAAAALAVAAILALTGALHEDGLADTVDGFGGGTTRQEKLDIMRDARIGTYGVCALILSLLIRVGAVASLADAGAAAAALIAAHAAARAAMPAVMFWLPAARSDGLSFAAGRPPGVSTAVAALLGFLTLAFCLGFGRALAALAVVAIGVFLVAQLSRRQIDGQTGDVLGAVEQVGEILVLLVAVG